MLSDSGYVTVKERGRLRGCQEVRKEGSRGKKEWQKRMLEA